MVAAKCEAACRAKSRQALCKANTASRRLVLVSGRLVSLALFIVSATRHLLETRLCPPVSTQHRTEGACQHYPSTSSLLPFPRHRVFPSSRSDERQPPLTGREGVASDCLPLRTPRPSDWRRGRTGDAFAVCHRRRSLDVRAAVCLVSPVGSSAIPGRERR